MISPGVLLRVEGLAFCACAVYAYGTAGFSWGLFALLFLAPDLSMLAYFGGLKAGAAVYNLFHFYSLPLVLLAGSWYFTSDLGVSISLIWAAHIGFDRLLGYGIKYESAFKDTHLQRA